jgi:hypothetical protein
MIRGNFLAILNKVKGSAKTGSAADVLETLYLLSENKICNFCSVM